MNDQDFLLIAETFRKCEERLGNLERATYDGCRLIAAAVLVASGEYDNWNACKAVHELSDMIPKTTE